MISETDSTVDTSRVKVKTLDTIVTLKDIKIDIKKGEFVVIIGDVGCGKSSLLQALIGEMLYVDDALVQKYGGEQGLEKVISSQEQIENFQKDLVNATKMLKKAPIEMNGQLAYVQ